MLLQNVIDTEEKPEGKQNEKARNCVSLSEFREELLAMLDVCFKGKAGREGEKLFLVLPGGERFVITTEIA